jgi:hypothetical protein
MDHRTPPRVVVFPMESGPQGPGRPVQVGSQDVGIAESWDDVDRLLQEHGVPPQAPVLWRGGGADIWE